MLQLEASPIHTSPFREGEGAKEQQGIFFSFHFKRDSYNSFLPFLLASRERAEVERVWLTERGKHEVNLTK